MTDGKVVGLRGQPIAAPGTPEPSVIELAKWLLEAATSGEINGIGVVMRWHDEGTSCRIRGLHSYATLGQSVHMQEMIRQELEQML